MKQRNHEARKCKCNLETCMICTGGIFICSRCGLIEGCLTTECCGEPAHMAKSDQVYTGRIDFYDGHWVEMPSVNCPAYWTAQQAEGRDWDRELSPICKRMWPDTIRESWEKERYAVAVTQYKNLNAKVLTQQWRQQLYGPIGSLGMPMRDVWELDFLKDWDCHEREQ